MNQDQTPRHVPKPDPKRNLTKEMERGLHHVFFGPSNLFESITKGLWSYYIAFTGDFGEKPPYDPLVSISQLETFFNEGGGGPTEVGVKKFILGLRLIRNKIHHPIDHVFSAVVKKNLEYVIEYADSVLLGSTSFDDDFMTMAEDLCDSFKEVLDLFQTKPSDSSVQATKRPEDPSRGTFSVPVDFSTLFRKCSCCGQTTYNPDEVRTFHQEEATRFIARSQGIVPNEPDSYMVKSIPSPISSKINGDQPTNFTFREWKEQFGKDSLKGRRILMVINGKRLPGVFRSWSGTAVEVEVERVEGIPETQVGRKKKPDHTLFYLL
jgi:hypothetical protein